MLSSSKLTVLPMMDSTFQLMLRALKRHCSEVYSIWRTKETTFQLVLRVWMHSLIVRSISMSFRLSIFICMHQKRTPSFKNERCVYEIKELPQSIFPSDQLLLQSNIDLSTTVTAVLSTTINNYQPITPPTNTITRTITHTTHSFQWNPNKSI